MRSVFCFAGFLQVKKSSSLKRKDSKETEEVEPEERK